ncbi:MAG: tetratricopeptide repeat protein [Bacteroidota bacterium]
MTLRKCINIFSILFLGFVVLQIQGCKSSKSTTSSANKQAESYARERKLHEVFIEANRAKILGDFDKAINLFNQSLEIDPKNAAACFELAGIYETQAHYRDAFNMAQKAAQLDQTNIWYLYYYAQMLEDSRQYNKAVEQYEKLLKLNPSNPEYLGAVAENLLFAGHFSEAIKAYDKLEQQIGIVEQVSLQKQKIYLELKKPDKAVEEIEKLIAQDPQETKYYTVLAETYLLAGKKDEALKTYSRAEQQNPNDPFLQISLSDFYRKQGEKAKSIEMLLKAFANPGMNVDSKVQVLLAFYSYSDKDSTIKGQAYQLLDELIRLYPNEAKVNSIHGDFLLRDEKYPEARDAFRKVIAEDSSRFPVWEGLLRVEAQLEDNKALISESKRASELFPEQPGPWFFAGFAYYQTKDYLNAITSFKKAEKLIVDNDGLLRDLYSFLGDSYNQVKDNKSSDESYDKSLKIDPKNTYVLNNYSYYLSLRGENLEKAEKMAKLVNDLSPDNASYLDTYAWVMYKYNKLDEAEKLVLKAIEKGADKNAVILEHYGDILYKKGEKDKAVQIWESALKAGKGSEFLEKKVNEKHLVE